MREIIMRHAIDTLKNEHEAITLGLKILTRMDERVSAEQVTDIQDLSALTDFLKAFADTCHHGKEEGILFPAMQTWRKRKRPLRACWTNTRKVADIWPTCKRLCKLKST